MPEVFLFPPQFHRRRRCLSHNISMPTDGIITTVVECCVRGIEERREQEARIV